MKRAAQKATTFLGMAIALVMLLGIGVILLFFSGAGAEAIWNAFQ